MFDLERDSAIDASIMALTALSVIAAPYQGFFDLFPMIPNNRPFCVLPLTQIKWRDDTLSQNF